MMTMQRVVHSLNEHPCRIRIAISLFAALALLLPCTSGFAINGNILAAPYKMIDFHSSEKHFNSLQTRLRKETKAMQSRYRIKLYSQNGDGTNNDGDINSQDNFKPNKRSVARAGGRKSKIGKPPNPNNNRNTNSNSLGFLRQWAAPLILGALLLKFIFGGLFSPNPNVVYYSRSVYQSTTYSRDGNVETQRKETFQSNIPGLVERSTDARGSVSIENEFGDLDDEILDAFNIRAW